MEFAASLQPSCMGPASSVDLTRYELEPLHDDGDFSLYRARRPGHPVSVLASDYCDDAEFFAKASTKQLPMKKDFTFLQVTSLSRQFTNSLARDSL